VRGSHPRRQQSFSLVELLLVFLIIAALIAVAAPTFLGQGPPAKDSDTAYYLGLAYKRAQLSSLNNNNTTPTLESTALSPALGVACEEGLSKL